MSLSNRQQESDLLHHAHVCAARGDWAEALAQLIQANRQQPSAALQQLMIDWRIRAGRSAPEAPGAEVSGVQAVEAGEGRRRGGGPLDIPEVHADGLTPESLRDALRDTGTLIVRGLIDESLAADLRGKIDRVVAARENPEVSPPVVADAAWYSRSEEVSGAPSEFFRQPGKVVESSSIWAADSPHVACEVLALYRQLGLQELLQAYFGEPARLSVKKWVLRKVAPEKNGNAGWHQDGRFLGENIRTVNLWLALSDCGGDAPAPGIDLLVDGERKIQPTGTDGAWFNWTVGEERVARLAADKCIAQPRFAPGDAILFDHYSLHRTALENHHSAVRYAIESWFFAASTAPARQQPIFL